MAADMKRIGLLVPSSNTTMEVDFFRHAPTDVTVHTGRLYLETNRVEDLMRMHEDVIREAKYLATADVDVIIFGCTGGSFVKGVGYDLEVARVIKEATGIPTVTTSTALVDAMQLLKIRQIAFGTPYRQYLIELGQNFFDGNGFKVIRTGGLGLTRNLEIGRLDPESGYDMACQLNGEDVDAILLSCTNWSVMSIIERAEKKIGKPVLSSNQASLWGALRALEYSGPIDGLGTLMKTLGHV